MFWKEVREHLQNGARLVYTSVVPGGSSVALHYKPRLPSGRAKLIYVRRAENLPAWADEPALLRDERPLKAALERIMAAEEEEVLSGYVNFPRFVGQS